jgi:hypothetical protein
MSQMTQMGRLIQLILKLDWHLQEYELEFGAVNVHVELNLKPRTQKLSPCGVI